METRIDGTVGLFKRSLKHPVFSHAIFSSTEMLSVEYKQTNNRQGYPGIKAKSERREGQNSLEEVVLKVRHHSRCFLSMGEGQLPQ